MKTASEYRSSLFGEAARKKSGGAALRHRFLLRWVNTTRQRLFISVNGSRGGQVFVGLFRLSIVKKSTGRASELEKTAEKRE
jgi:hypothetical protein